MPLFKQKLGDEAKPMRVLLRFKDINVLFGQHNTDVIFEYTMMMTIMEDRENAPELMYDEVRMITCFDI